MVSQIVTRWRSALQVKSFRIKIIISGVLLGLCGFAAPPFFQFIQQREGYILNDYLLTWLPAYDVSIKIFILLYILILLSVFSLLQHPPQLLVALQAYIVLTLLRFITILLFPLEPPLQILELHDPFVQHLFYHQSVTKDLFFSGHTSLLVLLAFTVQSPRLRVVIFTGAFVVAMMLLLQHVHYTVDIVAAPFFSWLAVTLAKKIP